MRISGEVRVNASPDVIIEQFKVPERLQSWLPGCTGVTEVRTGLFLIDIKRLTDDDVSVQQYFRVDDSEMPDLFTVINPRIQHRHIGLHRKIRHDVSRSARRDAHGV